MEDHLPKFLVGAKVFAKLKGYTAWPATIDGIHPSLSGKFKYDVFFYGTNQVGTCREEELSPYIENRKTLGRPKHYKGFNEAVEEMDLELGLVSFADEHTTVSSESENEAELVVRKRGRSKTRARSEEPTMRTRSRSRSASMPREDATIKRGRGRPRSKSQSRERSVSQSSDQTTKRRRGRPRSLSRTRSEPSDDPTYKPSSDQTTKRGRGRPRSLSRTRSEPSDDLTYKPSSDQTTKRGRGRPRSLSRTRSEPKVRSDDPTYTPYQRTRSTPHTILVSRKRSVSLNHESGDTYVKPNLKAFKCIINPNIESPSAMKEALEFLKNEAALNDAIFGIQACLSLGKADLEVASKHIDEFFILDLNPLLMKKHPDAVDTFEKLQRYRGNLKNWNMPINAKKAFQHDLKIINMKANLIYNRIKGLFHIPDGKDFSQVFEEELNKFKSATKGIPIDTVWKMTRDPTLV